MPDAGSPQDRSSRLWPTFADRPATAPGTTASGSPVPRSQALPPPGFFARTRRRCVSPFSRPERTCVVAVPVRDCATQATAGLLPDAGASAPTELGARV